MTPKNRPNQTKIKLKFDNKKVKLADKKRIKKKEEPKKESLVVKFPKPVLRPPQQATPNPQVLQITQPILPENFEEMDILSMIDNYNDGNYTLDYELGIVHSINVDFRVQIIILLSPNHLYFLKIGPEDIRC